MRPQVQEEVYGATIDLDLEPPELIEGDLVELTIPGRAIRHFDGQFAWRSVILSQDTWLWTYREHRPSEGVGVVRAYLYLGPDAIRETVVGLATTGSSYAVSRALRYLGEEVAAFRAEDASDPLTLFHGRPPLDITGELVIARDEFFPYSVRSLRAIVPTFVVESVFGGIGGVVETYLAYQDLKILARRPADLDYIYYSLATGGPRWGDERVQLIELIRSIDDEWPQPSYVSDWLDRELRAGPEYVTCIGRLISDDWGSWWNEDAGRPLIYGHQLTEYYQAIGQAPYRFEDEFDDEGWEREDDEELWEPDWVDPDRTERVPIRHLGTWLAEGLFLWTVILRDERPERTHDLEGVGHLLADRAYDLEIGLTLAGASKSWWKRELLARAIVNQQVARRSGGRTSWSHLVYGPPHPSLYPREACRFGLPTFVIGQTYESVNRLSRAVDHTLYVLWEGLAPRFKEVYYAICVRWGPPSKETLNDILDVTNWVDCLRPIDLIRYCRRRAEIDYEGLEEARFLFEAAA
ncbi:hypothetical protein CBR_g51443 [Chara braunii]|uniref:Uncharacterized protein n=1 Tax=Chara braunii TaxID=69332 RepID=A0A388K680_CHABU|nr:hypothetical protein CBR_g51443 [Chara braunii]|eukprot:GBG65560.1 hypothetical protein CBR_g51443 [Chara braunii]